MKTLIVVVVIILLAGLGVWYFYSSPATETGSTPLPTPTGTQTGVPTTAAKEVVVNVGETGFLPKDVTLNVGDSIKFVNVGTKAFWPASGPHPVHTACPGLDPKKALDKGDAFSFVFSQAETCPIHNHLDPSTTGSITVK
ncbi:hypothetical protein HYT01_03110 [Candidatus Giovannonibacteria bacterium]|nr:hypothetical protein [Candidatus Giovannonibacteria bacterium]